MIGRYKRIFNAAPSADVMRHDVMRNDVMRNDVMRNDVMRNDVMRNLATILMVLVTAPSWAGERDSLLQQAEALGAPMAAVQRAIEISHQPIFVKKDVLAVFDISQPSARKDFTFWISNQVRSPPITRPMEETMDPTQSHQI